MSKILFWVVTILVVLLAMRILARMSVARQQRAQRDPSRRPIPRRYADMVQCAHCSVHLPKSDAIRTLGHYWCSEEHARLGRRR